MATAADSVLTLARGGHPALGAKVGVIEVVINLATVSAELVAQGDGALTAGDVIECLSIPKGTTVLAAGLEVVTAVSGGSCSATDVDLGVTGSTVDRWVDGADLVALGAGGYATTDDTVQSIRVFTVADTIDLLINSMTTGDLTAGKIRVFAVVVDTDSLVS